MASTVPLLSILEPLPLPDIVLRRIARMAEPCLLKVTVETTAGMQLRFRFMRGTKLGEGRLAIQQKLGDPYLVEHICLICLFRVIYMSRRGFRKCHLTFMLRLSCVKVI